jgi:hypothetical protein
MEIRIETNFPDVQRQLTRMQQDVGGKALASALNKSIALARTQMTREIPAEFMVTAGYVRERLRIKRAAAGRGGVELRAELAASNRRGRSANIIAFVEKSTTLAQARKRAKEGTQQQLFVKIKRKGGRKSLGPLAFIGNKGRTVFKRKGKSRLPIAPLQTIDVTQMFNTRRINGKVIATIKERFADIFANEVRFFTARATTYIPGNK